MEPIIEISHLYKSFGEVKAVQDLSFQVKKGELFAFLGLNGAGKSTTISILCGQLAKDAGQVHIHGRDLDQEPEVKRELGVVFQNSVLDGPLTVLENLRIRAALYGITGKQFDMRLEELDALLGLKETLRRPVGKLSGGQRRKADIARALLHAPKILILDEPTTGLDPQTRKTVWDVVARLRREQDLTVFLTTHYMEEAAEADDVIILDSGKIAAAGTVHALKTQYAGDYLTLYGLQEEQVAQLGRPYTKLHDAYRLLIGTPREATELICAYPALFADYELTKGKMDDVFLAATGKKLAGGDGQ